MKKPNAPFVIQVYFKDRKVFFELSDGREAGCPLDWFAGLRHASQKELMDFRVSAKRRGAFFPNPRQRLAEVYVNKFAQSIKKATKKHYCG